MLKIRERPVGQRLFTGHDPEDMIRKVLITPAISDNIYVRSEISRVYMYLKKYNQSIPIVKKILKDVPEINSPRLLAILAISYFNTNHSDETIHILEELKQLSNKSTSGSPAFYTAMIYASMRKPDLAFEWLGKAFTSHEVEMYWLKVEPPFEPLRNDPRYKELLDKVGFSK